MDESSCPECGHHNQNSARFCSSCGAEISWGDPTKTEPVIKADEDGPLADIDRSSFGTDQALFVVIQGAKAGARYLLDSDVVKVGRHPDSDIFLDDITVSRRHAEVACSAATYRVNDVGSLNGTYVNRLRVDDAELFDGDELRIGKFRLIFAHGTGPQ